MCIRDRFCAEVPLWEYREPESLYGDFSTEKWRKISLYKDTECRSSDLYRGDCISFRTEKDFQMFLSDYEGTAFAAPGPKSVIVWCYRDAVSYTHLQTEVPFEYMR